MSLCYTLWFSADGNSIISLGYKGEENFRDDVKEVLKDMNATFSRLQKFKSTRPTPSIRLTYYDGMIIAWSIFTTWKLLAVPKEYEPKNFIPCPSKHYFKTGTTLLEWSTQPLVTDSTAILFDLKSKYKRMEKKQLEMDESKDTSGF